MAEHLGKDPKTYADEYRDFCRELRAFHDIRGTSFNRLPRLHGHEVDLYLLYSLVTSRGGWEKVNINGDWESLLPYFGIHRLCANGPIALKQIYVRFLDVYERIHFLGEEVDRRESELHEEDDARNRRKALRLLHATPTSYNASQHYVPDHVRSMPGSGLSTEAIQVTATERIFLSLLSPLPNEQDFAINVCSLLAMESRKPFPLHQCPRIVDALLAHAGVFSQVDLRDSFTESYRKFRGQDLAKFWQDVVIDSDIAQLSEEDLLANQEKMNAALDSYWTHLLHTSKEPGEKVETTNLVDPDPEVATMDEDDEHFFARPTFVRTENGRRPLDDLETSLMGDDDEEEGEEEESQCSVGLYENGTGPPSASQSDMVLVPSPVTVMNDDSISGQPSFANCLSKAGNGIQSNENHLTVNSEEDGLLRLTETQEIGTLETSLGINIKETREVELHETNQAIAAPTAELTSDQGTTSFLLDTSVEKIKILPPRNRLPVANMKPDNPRAVRYWLDQRRTARSFPQQTNDVGRELEGLRQSREPEDWELFHGGREHGVHDLLGQRVLQVLNVVRNLSFDDANSSILAQSEACLRLLLLATHAKWSCLPQLAFDALSNMALDINLKDPGDCTLSAVLLGTVTRGLESSDRFIILRCMEIIGSLAQRSDHETLLMSALDSRVFERLCSYLTIPDVALLIYTLECVYALSSLGQTTCNAFLLCQGTVDVLISLLTIEAQSYGSKARILMNVVETVAEGDAISTHAQLTPIHPAMRPAYSNSPANAPSTPPPALLQSAASPVPTTPASQTKILPKTSVVLRPDISSTSTVISGTVSHTEKEQIAMQWLKTSFEPVVGAASIEQNALYRQYSTGCAKNGPKQVLGIVQFFSCVRATFGQNVGPFRKQVGNGVEFYFEGMSPRGSSAPVVQVASVSPMSPTPAIEAPGSPILKAQLCAPPKANNRKDILKPSLAHPHLSQALGPSGQPDPGSKISCVTNASGSGPPSSSLIKSLLANKVPMDASEANSNTTGGSNLPVTQVASLGLSPTATALPGMTKVPCMNSHASLVLPLTNPLTVSTSTTLTTSAVVPSTITIANQKQVAQRQQQQKLLQQQQQVLNGPTTNSAIKGSQNTNSPKVNGFSSEILEESSSENKVGGKGMLADLLEREVKKESINGAVVLPGKELRISDNGLELVSKDARGRFAVDMGVVGMNNLTGVDLGDGAAAPKAAHLIAQVDDSGHVQIHLEEETDSSICNGQSLLDQLEACQVVSSTSDLAPASECKAPKRPNPKDESECPTPKKAMLISNNHHETLEKTVEATRTRPTTIQSTGTEKDAEKLVNGVSNGTVNPSIVSLPSASNSSPVALQSPQPVILGPNAPRTFLILQPQMQNQQQNSAAGFQPQGQRLLLAIQRPGGVVQHVAMPANVVAISSSQLQTNGGVVTLTTTGGITTIVSGGHTLPAATSTVPPTSTLITTVASTSSAVVTTASVEGMVTFSGGAVAFPARPTENTTRTSNLGDSHVTITPVSASSITSTSPSTSGSAGVAAAVKKRTNSIESPKPRGRPAKSKSTDGSPVTPPMPTNSAVPISTPAPIPTSTNSSSASPTPLPPFNPTHQYVCEWKDCMKAFKTPNEVYVHACYSHCPAHVEELGCLWEHCDGLKRRRFSMMTHLMDRHCNDEMQKILAARRLQMSTLGKTDIPAPQAPTPHPGYAPHAALHAIKRHAVELMNHKEQEEKEGPVTKSIRLTSALILRNLAIHSSLGRRILKRYEGHLASVALSNVESSRTVAQILFELTHHQSS